MYTNIEGFFTACKRALSFLDYIQTLQFTILSLFLQEEALRQKRLASSRSEAASSVTSSNRSEAFSVQAMNPDATALSTTYIYAALVVLVIGIIIGKWIFWNKTETCSFPLPSLDFFFLLPFFTTTK